MPHRAMSGSSFGGRTTRIPSRRSVSRHNFADDVVLPRDERKYVTVRAGTNPKPKAKRRGVPVPSLPRQSKSRTLRRDTVRRQSVRRKRRVQVRGVVMAAVACGIFAVGGLLSYQGWRANHTVEVQAQALTQAANKGDASNSSAAPSTVKPTPAEIASYVVPATYPKYLVINKLAVNARVRTLGVDKTGQLQTPSNVYDTGWYNGSVLPGQNGAMLIDGHVSSWTAHGVFYGLKTLKPGDTMQVVRGDGKTFNYKVVKTQVYDANNVDMAAAMTSVVTGKPGLNLITCTGEVKPGTSEFNQRLVVFTEQM